MVWPSDGGEPDRLRISSGWLPEEFQEGYAEEAKHLLALETLNMTATRRPVGPSKSLPDARETFDKERATLENPNFFRDRERLNFRICFSFSNLIRPFTIFKSTGLRPQKHRLSQLTTELYPQIVKACVS